MSEDRSHLDRKYFIDNKVYNCPFCNRRNVRYSINTYNRFNWSSERICNVWMVKCSDCRMISMHLTFEDIGKLSDGFSVTYEFQTGTDLDAAIFYSVPSSFFVTDSRIPRILRELITEAEGCQKMNFLTGAAACTRKAIYEFTILEEAKGDDYETRIKHLKKKFGNIDPSHFEILCSIKDMTSPNRISHRGFTSMGALV